jgi:hypothetical protein
MTDRRRLNFETWVPEAAKSELQQLANTPDGDHPLLRRLASYTVMRDEVWKKLPAAARGAEGLIIRQTYAVARVVEAWQTIEHVRKYNSLRPAKHVARLASKLARAMKQTSGDASDIWHLWRGDGQVTFAVALSVVEQLATFYCDADDLYKELGEQSNKLSRLRKKNAKNAPEVMFARWLASSFQREFGKPLDPIISALSSVVFNKGGEGALAPTIRGRRRSAPRKGTFAGAAS